MNKEDVLKKARQENNDEREEHVKMKAFHMGWISVSLVMLFIIIFRALHNESASDVVMILMAQVAAVSFYQYAHMRDKKVYLFSGVISAIAIVLALAALLSEYGVY